MLNDNEKKKFEIIDKVISRKMTRKEAIEELNLSRQQIYRLIVLYHSKGKNGFIHGNRGRANLNKKDDSLIKEIEELYLNEFYDFNFEQFYEKKILGKYDISYDVVLKRFTKDDIISPLAHKKTVKNYNEKIKEAIANNEDTQQDKIELYKSRIIAFEKAHTRRSSNLFVFGQEVQMDACEKFWFGGIVSYLHLAVDKATKKVLFGLV